MECSEITLKNKEKSIFIYHHDFLSEQMITHSTCFVTKQAYDRFGLFDTKYHSAADYDLMLRFGNRSRSFYSCNAGDVQFSIGRNVI